MNKPLRFVITLWALACLQITVAVADGPREAQLFDFDWRFSKGDVTHAQNPALDDHSWRLLDLPHDWSIEDLPALTNAPIEPAIFVTKGAWRFRKGDDPASRGAT